ncbi:MAG TPA: hydroxysqualene dehydroxylase HpnE, partial [Candidatus Acidoferrum sp.]|nr:hydroxysqualene dehydroxylase HpnE [Candidatus Acidoferrum sp.]
ATSYVLPNGEHVDNCQHVTLGCCTNLEDFYRRVGSAGKLQFFDRLFFLDPQRRTGVMQAGFLPAPLHMTGSFLSFAPLSAMDKLSIGRALAAILFSGGRPKDAYSDQPVSMLAWLERHRQTHRAIERFWRVVLVSALDEELDRTDARFGIDVFWKAFLKNGRGYRMGVPSVPLAELYLGCRAAIEARSGEVNLRSPVRSLCVKAGTLEAVQFDGGREESADAFVLAIPQDRLHELLPDEVRAANPLLAGLERYKVSPITGVHFWFDREVTEEPFLTLLDTQTQWIFNKTALYGRRVVDPPLAARAEDAASVAGRSYAGPGPAGEPGAPVPAVSSGQYLQLVVSASYDLLRKSREEIIELCLREVHQALPAAREAQLLKATVIKEASATFSPEPGVDRWRPAQQTATPRLVLAGDWTATGWPATMEGAVRSGYLAAEAVLRSVGSAQSFLVPDLPASGLSRLFD